MKIRMLNIKLVLVESKYQINLGYIARTAKNFGLSKLYLLNPKCNFNGSNAIKYSKHARELLQNAVVIKNLSNITKNNLIIGTTGIWTKTSSAFFNINDPDMAYKKIKKSSQKNICLLIGRDNTGLTKEELMLCDLTIFIPANKKYPVLNISHALAIILYQLTKEDFKKNYNFNNLYANMNQIKNSVNLFKEFIKSSQHIRNKKAISMIFEHVLKRANPTSNELKALNILFHKNNKN